MVTSVSSRLLLKGEYFRCPPSIILIFGYVIEDRKIKKYVFFYFSPFSYFEGGGGGVKTAFKFRVEKSFLWKKWTF